MYGKRSIDTRVASGLPSVLWISLHKNANKTLAFHNSGRSERFDHGFVYAEIRCSQPDVFPGSIPTAFFDFFIPRSKTLQFIIRHFC